jgi:hypothetical protein
MGDSEPGIASDPITPANFRSRAQQCQEYLSSLRWDSFDALYTQLSAFADEDEDVVEFEEPWRQFRDSFTQFLIRRLESVSNFDDFQVAMARLAIVLNDPQELWTTMHNKINANIKVTLNQSQILAITYFTPMQLFEFGFPAFSQSSLCEMTRINNDEALVDIFYAVAGFVAACELPANYVARIPCYMEFIRNLLTQFVALPDFDAQRFIWLVEAIRQHLRVDARAFLSLCEGVIQGFADDKSDTDSLSRLHKLCIISTSPFLRDLDSIPALIDRFYRVVIMERRDFVRKFIFAGYAGVDWDAAAGRLSDPCQAWCLFLKSCVAQMTERRELPGQLLATILDDSLHFFVGYYGGVQTSQTRAAAFRLELFTIVKTIDENYTEEMTENMVRQMHYLLYLAAVSGATDLELESCAPAAEPIDPAQKFLGLEVAGSDFVDYEIALGKLAKYFEGEFSSFPAMATFVRANYAIGRRLEGP